MLSLLKQKKPRCSNGAAHVLTSQRSTRGWNWHGPMPVTFRDDLQQRGVPRVRLGEREPGRGSGASSLNEQRWN